MAAMSLRASAASAARARRQPGQAHSHSARDALTAIAPSIYQ